MLLAFFFFFFGFWSADGQPLTSGLRFYFLPGNGGREINEELGHKLDSRRCRLGTAPLCPQPGEFLAPRRFAPEHGAAVRCQAPRGWCFGFWGAFALGFGVRLLWVLGCVCSKPSTSCFHQTRRQTAPPQGCGSFLSQTFFPFPETGGADGNTPGTEGK